MSTLAMAGSVVATTDLAFLAAKMHVVFGLRAGS
jgi:hypothetical protein